MLEELFKSGRLFAYAIDDENSMYRTTGIVIADSGKEAKKKIVEAYTTHGYSRSELTGLEIWKVTEGYFNDAPDVLEIE